MPTYQYACSACGYEFEMVQSFSDDAISVCPECTGEVRKVYTNVGVVFKGSGFYKTDSRSSSAKNPSTGGDSSAKPAATPAPSSSD